MKKYFFLLACIISMSPIVVDAESIGVQLEKCIDASSAQFKSSDGSIRTYRFLGITAPESYSPTKGEEPFSQEASEYTCNVLTNVETLTIEQDEIAGLEDSYGRGQGWIFIDGVLLQERLVEQGYAKVEQLDIEYKYTNVLLEKQELAKESQLGVWKQEEKREIEIPEQEKEQPKKKKNFIFSFFDSILDSIAAGINQVVDSILQSIEGML